MMQIMGGGTHVPGDSLEPTWHPDQFAPEIDLGAREGALLVDSLTRWIGTVFGLLANTKGVRGAYPAYRVKTRDFFKLHRHSAYVAVTNMGPVVRIVAETFSIGTGIQLKGSRMRRVPVRGCAKKGIAA